MPKFFADGGEAGLDIGWQSGFQALAARQAEFAAIGEQKPRAFEQADGGARRHHDGARAVQQFGQIILIPFEAIGHGAHRAQNPDFGIAPCEMPDRGTGLGLNLDNFGRAPILLAAGSVELACQAAEARMTAR